MPAILVTLIGAFVSGLTTFFASRAGLILAGMGLTFIGVKGFQTIIGFFINDLNTLVGIVSSSGQAVGNSGNLGQIMMQFAAFAGLFDGLNIIISGYMTFASFIAVRFIIGRLGS